MISVPFELEQVEFGMLIPSIPLPEKSQKECGLNVTSIFVRFLLSLQFRHVRSGSHLQTRESINNQNKRLS